MKRGFVLILFLAAPLQAADLRSSFSAGETLDFDLTWVVITGGSMRMTIGPQPGDTTHFRITSIAASSVSFARIFSVRDAIESFVTRDDFSTVRYEKHLDERGRRKDDSTVIDELRIGCDQALDRPGSIAGRPG